MYFYMTRHNITVFTLTELPHDMTEPVEELQEGVLRARSDRVITSTVSRELYEDNRDTEDDYENLCQKLEEHLEDIKACDAQVCVLVLNYNCGDKH